MDSKLSSMERRAISGMEAIGRELQMRHAIETENFYQDYRAMLSEIAEAHELPLNCWETGSGISMETWEIIQTIPAEEPVSIKSRKKRKAS